jgi:hypothetical protein
LLLTGVALALLVGGLYILMNDSAGGATSPNYAATAIFKLTATKEALLQPTLPVTDSPDGITPSPLPTNTPRPLQTPEVDDALQQSGASPPTG